MKKAIKEGMKNLVVKYLTEFAHDKEKDAGTIECYANNFVNDFERWMAAYNDFKED